MDLKDKIQQAKIDIMELYLNESDKRPWAVGWSGGKDSSCVGGLVVQALMSLPPEKRWREVHFVMSDTIMENPQLDIYMEEQREQLSKFAAKHNLPIHVQQVKRPEDHSYFYLVIGRGYPLPQKNGGARWCTDRLKLKPQAKYLKDIDPCYVLTGVRSAESAQRAKSIDKFRLEEKIAEVQGEPNRKVFMPIVTFDVEEVWKYLTIEGLPWGSTLPVRTLYKEATGECGFTNPKGVEKKSVEVCGARFGCWTCPVILNDRSTEKMSQTHEWMEPLTYWRELQLKIYGVYSPPKEKAGHLKGEEKKKRSELLKHWREVNEKVKLITKCGYTRKGVRMKKEGQGTLTVEAREILLRELLEVQKVVNRTRKLQGLAPLTLITDEEVNKIKRQWEEDKKEAPWLVTNPLGISIEEVERLLDL